jgi:membrane dipeptidase
VLRRIAIALLLSATAIAQTPKQANPEGPAVSARARRIQDSALVIDTHADTPQRFLDENFDIASDAGEGHIDLQKIHAANLGAEFFSIWVDPKMKGTYAHRAQDLIDSVYEQAKKHPDKMVMAFSAADIERAHQQKKFAALMGLEGGHPIENDIHILRDYYRLGIRYMTLTHTNTNEWADSSGDVDDAKVQHHNGLTDFGKQVVEEMNRLGMLVDISHVSDKTFWDTIATTKAPIIASHSSARALTNAPRNMTDDMLKAMTKNGGVVMVNFYNGFLDQQFLDAQKAQEADRQRAVDEAVAAWKRDHPGETVPFDVGEKVERAWENKVSRPPFSVLIDHIDHIAKIAGVDHVGLGSDFDGVSGQTPAGMRSAADLPKITQALLDRGYTEPQIRKILGGNLLRAFKDVERVSREMRGSTPEWSPEKQSLAPKTQKTQSTPKQ